MSPFFSQTFPCTEEEGNTTETIAVYKEGARCESFCCRFRIDVWLATIGNVFHAIDFTRAILTTDKLFLQFFLSWMIEVFKDLYLFSTNLILCKASWFVHG